VGVLSVSAAVKRRRSVRAFLPSPVDSRLIADVLTEATRAPSGGNLQPWRLFVLIGDSIEPLSGGDGRKNRQKSGRRNARIRGLPAGVEGALSRPAALRSARRCTKG
jgi:hypothetical protein